MLCVRGIKRISSKLPLCDGSVPPFFWQLFLFLQPPSTSPYNISSYLRDSPALPPLIYGAVCLLGISRSPRLEIGARGGVGMVISQWETWGTEFFPTHPQSQLPAPASAISNPETRTCVGALLQPLLPSRTSHSSEKALCGLFIGASAAPEGQDGGVNNLFSPFPRPSRARSPPPLPPLFAQMNVAGLA